MGEYHEDWRYESGAVARIRDLVGSEHAGVERVYRAGRPSHATAVGLEYMDGAAPEDRRELIAALMVHHLRHSGKFETVSRETVPSVIVQDL